MKRILWSALVIPALSTTGRGPARAQANSNVLTGSWLVVGNLSDGRILTVSANTISGTTEAIQLDVTGANIRDDIKDINFTGTPVTVEPIGAPPSVLTRLPSG